jgi:hypothetical protein
VRGRSCSSQAMPFIKEKIQNLQKPSRVPSSNQIYEPISLASSLKVSAHMLESALLVNDSKPGAPLLPCVRCARGTDFTRLRCRRHRLQ